MFRLAICDDEIQTCAEIESIILQNQQNTDIDLDIEVFNTGEALCRNIAAGNYFDLIFLDIEMPNMNGVTVGHKIREDMDNQTTQIVYVSCRESYYRDLFEVRPMNFVNKPIDPNKIIRALCQAQKLAGKLQGVFSYKIGYETFKIPYKNILWFESIERKIRLVKTDGEDYFYGNLDKITDELKQHRFLRIHRAYLVNYYQISHFKYTDVMATNDVVLPISKSNQKEVRNLLNEWSNEA